MSITSAQCRQGRALFAMTQQELSNASGVALRTIISFESANDRTPIAANLAALRRALEALGAVFTQTGVLWQSPLSEAQANFLKARQRTHIREIPTVADINVEAPCSEDEFLQLVRLQILDSAGPVTTLTAIGLHMVRHLRDCDMAKQRPDANPVARRLEVIARESDSDTRSKLAASLLADLPHVLTDLENKYLTALVAQA